MFALLVLLALVASVSAFAPLTSTRGFAMRPLMAKEKAEVSQIPS
jgi:hypothetical protein